MGGVEERFVQPGDRGDGPGPERKSNKVPPGVYSMNCLQVI